VVQYKREERGTMGFHSAKGFNPWLKAEKLHWVSLHVPRFSSACGLDLSPVAVAACFSLLFGDIHWWRMRRGGLTANERKKALWLGVVEVTQGHRGMREGWTVDAVRCLCGAWCVLFLELSLPLFPFPGLTHA
jgi:hypothetical protein